MDGAHHIFSDTPSPLLLPCIPQQSIRVNLCTVHTSELDLNPGLPVYDWCACALRVF